MSFIHPLLAPVRKFAGNVMSNGKKVSPELANKRLAICMNCDKLFRLTGNCKKCLCFVEEKVKYRDQSCPFGKW